MIREHIVFETRHGSPYDRGSADSYYGRPRIPHYYAGATMQATMTTKTKAITKNGNNPLVDWVTKIVYN